MRYGRRLLTGLSTTSATLPAGLTWSVPGTVFAALSTTCVPGEMINVGTDSPGCSFIAPSPAS